MNEGERKLPGPALFWVLLALIFLAALGLVLGRESMRTGPGDSPRAPAR